MIGIMGIMCCIVTIGIGVGFLAAGAVTSWQLGKRQQEAVEEAAKKQQALQEKAIKKAELRAKATLVGQKYQNIKNLQKNRADAASAVAYEKLMAERAHRAAVNKLKEANITDIDGSAPVTSKPTKGYFKGAPVDTKK